MADKIFYKNQEREIVDTVTSENFSDFKNFIKETSEQNKLNSQPQYNVFPMEIADDVNLESFFDKNMTPENQKCMEYFLTHSLSMHCSETNRSQLLNMSEKNPQFVYGVFLYAGNQHVSSYEFLMKGLEERSMLDNLKLFDYAATSDRNYFWNLLGTKEPVKHLTRTQLDILSRWENANHSSMIISYNQNLIESGILLNCDNLPAEWRKKVNKEAITHHKQETSWTNLDSKFMDKDFLKDIFKDDRIYRRHPIGPSKDAKTQKEKNVGILPQYYKNLRKALMEASKNMPSHDAYNYGKELTLNQRYQNLLKEIMGPYYEVEKNPRSLLYEVYLETAQKDIMDGRAQDLSSNAIINVLKEDKGNHYLRKIPSKVLTSKNIKLDYTKGSFEELQNLEDLKEYQLSNLANKSAKIMNRQEKDKIVQTLSDKVEQKEQNLQYLNEELKQKQKEEEKLKEFGQDVFAIGKCREIIKKTQNLYSDIKRNFKDGEANKQEAEVLSKDKIENLIAQALQGKDVSIDVPTQKSLPLLFGRKEEQERRENLSASISKMNEFLSHLSTEKNKYLQDYVGEILNPQTLEDAHAKEKEKNKIYQVCLNNFYNYWNTRGVEQQAQETTNSLRMVQEAKDKIIKRKNAIKKLAKDNVSIDEGEKLQDVSKLTGEEKHKARAANKKRGKDKLAEKARIAKEQDLKVLRARKLDEIER